MRSSSNRCSLRRRKRSKIRSARGSRPSFSRSTAAATTPPAPNSFASSRKPPPTSRPRSTARKRQRSGRVARRTASSSCSAANQAACGPLNNKIQQMRDNLERIQVRHGAAARRSRRPSARVSAAPSWWRWRRTTAARSISSRPRRRRRRAAAAVRIRCSGRSRSSRRAAAATRPAMSAPSGTFRTVCVRTCDGFYYPISAATNPARFAEDEKACRQSCPAAEVQLYSHRNPGEDINQAVSVGSQQPYTALPNAFRYRTALDQSCSCRRPGEILVAGPEEHRGPHRRAGRHRGERPARASIVAAARRRAGQADQAGAACPARSPTRRRRQTAPLPSPRLRRRQPLPRPAPRLPTTDRPSPIPNRTVRAVGPVFIPSTR